ncbi:MAG: hypothetical protein ACOYEF_07340 [Planifilum sp.]|jgi:hypothetical protein
MSTQRRWFSLAIGILFGAFDFYYHRLISDLTGGTVWFVLSLGIWLVPLLPIALHEARTSRSALRSAVAGLLTWCASIVSYYLTNAVHLLLIGRPSRPELHISRHRDSYFWENWRSVLYGEILIEGGIFEWIGFAAVGGLAIGWVAGAVFLYRRKKGHPPLSPPNERAGD